MLASRLVPFAVLALASAAGAQVRVDGNGVRAGNVVVDSSGVHTGSTEVTGSGVRVGRGGGTTIRTNGNQRTVHCGGGALTVDGNGNHLTVDDCSSVTLNGNVNDVDVTFPRDGRLSVTGNRNTVHWSAGPRVRVAVSSPGTKNVVLRR